MYILLTSKIATEGRPSLSNERLVFELSKIQTLQRKSDENKRDTVLIVWPIYIISCEYFKINFDLRRTVSLWLCERVEACES